MCGVACSRAFGLGPDVQMQRAARSALSDAAFSYARQDFVWGLASDMFKSAQHIKYI